MGVRSRVRAIVHGNPLATRHDVDDAVLAGLEEPHVVVRTGDDDARRAVHRLRQAASRPGAGPEASGGSSTPPDEIVEVMVGSTPVLFEVWRERDGWWAGGAYHDDVLVIEARGVEPEQLRLCRVLDIEPFLRQRREWIMRLRGEGDDADAR